MLSTSKQTYDIYPDGDFVLDVFECRGKAKVSYGRKREELQKEKGKLLDMVGMPGQPHAIKMAGMYGNTLLRVEG